MSLHCMVCGHGVDEGLNICVFCHNGYTSQLACSVCRQPVNRGSASCWPCSRPKAVPPQSTAMTYVLPTLPQPQASGLARLPDLPPLPGLTARLASVQTLPEQYTVSAHGIVADIRVNAVNATVLQHEAQLVAILESVADEASQWLALQAVMDPACSGSTRSVVRSCRVLAVNLKEEIELIQGTKQGITGLAGPSPNPDWHGFAQDRPADIPTSTVMQHLMKLAEALAVFAEESNFKLGHGDVARQNIKDCRMLVISIKELLEIMQLPRSG